MLFNFYRVHKYLYIHLRLVLQVYMQCLAIRRRWWKVFYVVNGMGPKQRNKEGETFAKSLKLCEIHSNMLFQKFWVYLQVQNRWARVSFLAQGAGICLFDTYFVQKVICGYSSVKEFILERSKLWLSCTQRWSAVRIFPIYYDTEITLYVSLFQPLSLTPWWYRSFFVY